MPGETCLASPRVPGLVYYCAMPGVGRPACDSARMLLFRRGLKSEFSFFLFTIHAHPKAARILRSKPATAVLSSRPCAILRAGQQLHVRAKKQSTRRMKVSRVSVKQRHKRIESNSCSLGRGLCCSSNNSVLALLSCQHVPAPGEVGKQLARVL